MRALAPLLVLGLGFSLQFQAFGQSAPGAALRAEGAASLQAPLPEPRPAGLAPLAGGRRTAAEPAPPPRLGPEEMVCRDPRLQGRRRPPVTGHLAGCGIAEPVIVTRIAGIKLSKPATLQCQTARAFANWVTGIVDPAAKRLFKRRVTGIELYGSYSCRNVNGRPGANLSRHAMGLAVDVAGVTLGDGTRISVLRDWGGGHKGAFLRQIWREACGLFRTVIGPEGDRFHLNHFHLDLARRRSSYCR